MKPSVMKDSKEAEKQEEVDLPFVALGMFHDKKNNEWIVARVGYDPVTQQAKFLGTVGSGGPSKDFGQEKFKIQTFLEGFF